LNSCLSQITAKEVLRIQRDGAAAPPHDKFVHGQLEVTRRADTRVEVDGVDVEVTAGVPLQLAPGPHRITLRGPDSVKVMGVDIKANDTTQVHD
jgi:hypothetical protein